LYEKRFPVYACKVVFVYLKPRHTTSFCALFVQSPFDLTFDVRCRAQLFFDLFLNNFLSQRWCRNIVSIVFLIVVYSSTVHQAGKNKINLQTHIYDIALVEIDKFVFLLVITVLE